MNSVIFRRWIGYALIWITICTKWIFLLLISPLVLTWVVFALPFVLLDWSIKKAAGFLRRCYREAEAYRRSR